MIVLLASLALAADLPIDVIGGKVLIDGVETAEDVSGILLTEERYVELLEAVADKKKLEADAIDFATWRKRQSTLFDETLGLQSKACSDGMDAIAGHYDGALQQASKRTLTEKQGFPLGLALGAVITAGLAVGTIAAVSNVYEIAIVR